MGKNVIENPYVNVMVQSTFHLKKVNVIRFLFHSVRSVEDENPINEKKNLKIVKML